MGLLVTDLYNAHGNGSHSSTAAPALAPSAASANIPRARPRAVAIHYFGNWYDRFAVC